MHQCLWVREQREKAEATGSTVVNVSADLSFSIYYTWRCPRQPFRAARRRHHPSLGEWIRTLVDPSVLSPLSLLLFL